MAGWADRLQTALHANTPCSFPAGESVTTGALTLDLSRMSSVRMAADGNSVTVQAGARVGQ